MSIEGLTPQVIERRRYAAQWHARDRYRYSGEPGSQKRRDYNARRRLQRLSFTEEHRQKIRERHKKWRDRNPGKSAEYERRKVARDPDFAKKKWLKKSYGMTLEEFTGLIRERGSSCEVCHVAFDFSSKVNFPHIDHDHNTGIVRGVLCKKCNLGIGMLGDDVSALKSALAYLERTLCR